MPLDKKLCKQFFSIIEEQLQCMSKKEIIKRHFELYYYLMSFKTEIHQQRVRGARNKNAESRDLKNLFESVCTKALTSIMDDPRRLRFVDISKELAKARPEIEWLGTGMKPVEANAKSQFKRSIRINKWLTEFNNKHFASKEANSR